MLNLKVENSLAFPFIFQDDIYLLNKDKADYYRTAETLAPTITEAVNFNCLGGNRQNFVVIVNYPGHEFMPDKHLEALDSVLKRKALQLDDVAIFNMTGQAVDFDRLNTFFNPKTLLILGQDALPAGMHQKLTLNAPDNSGGINTLFTFSFGEMMTDNDKKKAFWEQVKII